MKNISYKISTPHGADPWLHRADHDRDRDLCGVCKKRPSYFDSVGGRGAETDVCVDRVCRNGALFPYR